MIYLFIYIQGFIEDVLLGGNLNYISGRDSGDTPFPRALYEAQYIYPTEIGSYKVGQPACLLCAFWTFYLNV